MQFKVSQRALKQLMGYLYPVMEKKNTIPILGYILLEANQAEGKLTVTATDLDITLRGVIEADVQAGGGLCVPGVKLNDIIKLVDDDEINFREDQNEWVHITSGKARYRIGTAKRDQFTETSRFDGLSIKSFPVVSADLARMFRLTRDGITQEQSRFTLSGCKLEIENGEMRVITTDGHRLYFTKHSFPDQSIKMDLLIPKKAIDEIIKLSETTDTLMLGEDAQQIYVQAGDYKLLARKLNGNFPNYQMVIPDLKSYDKAVFDTGELKSCATRVALMADERTKSMKLSLKNNLLELSASSSEEGEGNEEMEVGYLTNSTDPVVIGFNGDYLRSCLSVSEMIQNELNADRQTPVKLSNMYFKDANAQVMFIPEGLNGTTLQVVIMPLRV